MNNNSKSLNLPFSLEQIKEIAASHPTPFYLYTEGEMIANTARLVNAFSWNPGFKEYFAVKATPNPFIMKLLHDHGLGMDASSLAELELCSLIGISGEDVMFTSNNTPSHEYSRAAELGAIINLDDISHIDYLARHVGTPRLLSFRLNPGDALGGSEIIGHPKEAKFGFTIEQLFEGYKIARQMGVKRFGLHTMPISNQLDISYFPKTVRILLEIAIKLKNELGIALEFINMGGGLGIPYKPGEQEIDIHALSKDIKACYEETLRGSDLTAPKLFMECGRYITGPYGYLITTAVHTKDTFRRYIGVDATMANLMRPGMYDAYHHVTVLGKESRENTELYDIVGSLCENNDKFAKQRHLPTIDIGDILVIHDAGAHGHSMGFNYNGKLRSSELLLRRDGSVLEIRRKESLRDLFSTIDLTELKGFLKR